MDLAKADTTPMGDGEGRPIIHRLLRDQEREI